jgi:hypothetical protein
MLSVIVGYEGQLPPLPKQWQPSSQIGTTLLDKTFPFVCTGTCKIKISCNRSTETHAMDTTEVGVEIVVSFIIATAITLIRMLGVLRSIALRPDFRVLCFVNSD